MTDENDGQKNPKNTINYMNILLYSFKVHPEVIAHKENINK